MSLTVYTFHRADGWYPMALRNDEEARANAECNPGTLSVKTVAGVVVWQNNDSANIRLNCAGEDPR